ncbi:MAG TPA: DUF4328 domain-containing protein [Labilithrix sp.]|nr:DUF4328 domain-containing protein [Labilithrix sp.]
MSYDPYAPPQQLPGGGPYGPGLLGVYERLGWKTKVTAALIAVSVSLSIVLVGLTQAAGKPTAATSLVYLGVTGLLAVITQLASLGGGVLFLVWIHQASKNAHSFRQGLAITPGWSVAWWFIPVASLWKPYQALAEIWRASDPSVPRGDESWRARPPPGTFPLWWGLYLVSGFVSLAGAVLSALAALQQSAVLPVAIVKDEATGQLLVALSLFLSAMAAVAVISIMRQLDRRQEALSQSAAPSGT